MAIDPCPAPTPVTTGVVRFVESEFKAQYPSFGAVAGGLLQLDFDIATTFLNNSCGSVVKDARVRERLLYLLTAHIAALLQGENGKAPSGVVGRVDAASEGSVSVSVAYANEMSMSEAYFAQTQYGVMFWQATAQYRMMIYVAPPSAGCFGGLPEYQTPGFPWGSCC